MTPARSRVLSSSPLVMKAHGYLIFYLVTSCLLAAEPPTLPGISVAMQSHIVAGDISGAVTLVVTKDRILHLKADGLADHTTARPMSTEAVFAIKSMTKPVTAIGLLMLQDAGKLAVTDPVATYLPAFADLLTPTGKPANLTIAQILSHTSGLGESRVTATTTELADLVRQSLAVPMQFEPGTRWKYTQSGIQTAGRIVEIVSGLTLDRYLSRQLFGPLGMKSTAFYPDGELQRQLVTVYAKAKDTGRIAALPVASDLALRNRPPLPNSGLYTTAGDLARLCQMLLNNGELDGHRYLKPETVRLLASPLTGGMPAGFVPGSAYALGTVVVTEPTGVTAMLSPGTYGHGGAYGTQLWIDPVKGVAYVLLIQRTGFGNGDNSDIRRDFQQAAVDALSRQGVTSAMSRAHDG